MSDFFTIIALFVASLCIAKVLRSFGLAIFPRKGVAEDRCARCRKTYKRGPFCSHCGYCDRLSVHHNGTTTYERTAANGHVWVARYPPTPVPRQMPTWEQVTSMMAEPPQVEKTTFCDPNFKVSKTDVDFSIFGF